jgi:hypothetical protein
MPSVSPREASNTSHVRRKEMRTRCRKHISPRTGADGWVPLLEVMGDGSERAGHRMLDELMEYIPGSHSRDSACASQKKWNTYQDRIRGTVRVHRKPSSQAASKHICLELGPPAL